MTSLGIEHATFRPVTQFFYLVCEAIGTAAIPGLLCQPRVIVKMMIVGKQMECRLAEETEVLGENLPQRHFCPSQNPTISDPVLNPGRRAVAHFLNQLRYGASYKPCQRAEQFVSVSRSTCPVPMTRQVQLPICKVNKPTIRVIFSMNDHTKALLFLATCWQY
jgi:hypothetical protein